VEGRQVGAPPDNSLFESCFRIQKEACEAAGRHIPMVVENVRGAQKWVGRARWNFGSFYLWGDVPALMPMNCEARLEGFLAFGSMERRKLPNRCGQSCERHQEQGCRWLRARSSQRIRMEKAADVKW